MVGIYKITNKINGKAYIGQSHNIEERWRQHKVNAFNPHKTCYRKKLYVAIREYGIENFLFEILEECNPERLNERENYWIDYYKVRDKKFGYNLVGGGNGFAGCCGRVSSVILCNKLENLQDTIENTAKMKEKRPYRIPKPSYETLLKDFYELGNRTLVAQKYNVSENLVRKWCNSYGFRCQDKKAYIEKYEVEFLGKEPEIRHPRKKVAQINPETKETIRVWNTREDIARYYGVSFTCISHKVKDHKLFQGYLFEFMED